MVAKRGTAAIYDAGGVRWLAGWLNDVRSLRDAGAVCDRAGMRALVANAVGSSVRRKRRAQQAVAVGDKCSSEESGERLGMRAVATVVVASVRS